MSLELSNNDLSVYTSNGKILSGGFSINSLLINQGLPAMMTVNSNTQMQIGGNNKVSDLFENLAVPSLVLHLDKKKYAGNIIVNHTDEQLDDDIYDKLLKLVEVHSKQIEKKTRKMKIKKDLNKTKKKRVLKK